MLYIDFGVSFADGVNGVGLRALETAAALADYCPVTVVAPEHRHRDITTVWPQLKHAQPSEVTPGEGDVYWYGFATPVKGIAAARSGGAICVFDAIIWPLEFLTYEAVRTSPKPSHAYQEKLGIYLQQLKYASKYVVASERERHVVTGMLSTAFWSPLHRMSPDLDTHFFELPVGFSRRNEARMEAVSPASEGDGITLVWNGGTWNHYDPTTAVKAVRALRDEGLQVSLRFLYPQRGTETQSLRQARQAAADSTAIHFAETGLGLLERIGELSVATAAICTYQPHALWDLCPPMRLRETLIYQLPILAPRRGALGDLIEQHAFGATAATNALPDWRKTILTLAEPADRQAMRRATVTTAEAFAYETTAGALWTWMNEARP
ncbi:glycosyltransferase [Catelliglobosispora koreensis]|uniref:glycosyltransferase n=1 Tax=Catelliglobosispora koreensis TaxID=129052 RepID=UPI00036A26C4|nr:hypothetical protein [Catelliglobosispora koreensis]